MTTVIARKLDALEEKGAIKAVDVANILDVRPETVSRWRSGKAFPHAATQQQLLMLEFMVDQLADLYEPQEARMWLYSPQKLLGNRFPAELVREGGVADVMDVIEQLRQGVFT